MARIRTIKPEAFTSVGMARLEIPVRWTFVGLWVYVDDYGRGADSARLVKASVYPLDDGVTAEDVESHLRVLASEGMIRRYVVQGRSYLHVCNFSEHQKVGHPTRSKLPEPPPQEPPPEVLMKIPEDPGGSQNFPEDPRISQLAPAGAFQAAQSGTGENYLSSTRTNDQAGTYLSPTSHAVSVPVGRETFRNARARPIDNLALSEAAQVIEDWWATQSPKPSSYEDVCEAVAAQLRAGWRTDSIVPALTRCISEGWPITLRTLENALRKPGRLTQRKGYESMSEVLDRAERRLREGQGQLEL